MVQVLLCGQGPYKGKALTVWLPQGRVGETVRWNGSPWRISARYGTLFSPSLETQAKRSEKPREGPLERFN